MPVLARFGQFWQFWRFTRNSFRSPPEGSRGLVESWSKGRPGAWPSGPYFPVSAGGVRPVIRAANSSSGRDVGCRLSDGLVVDPDGLSTRNVAGNWLRRVVGYA